jgi:hypothetical protein
MAATNDNNTVVTYGKTISNFGATYTATQESVKLQGTTIAAMQSQLNAMSQYLSRTKKSSNRNSLYREMSTRSGSNLVLRVPINFYSNTCNYIYKLIVSIMHKTFLKHNILKRVMSTRSGSIYLLHVL